MGFYSDFVYAEIFGIETRLFGKNEIFFGGQRGLQGVPYLYNWNLTMRFSANLKCKICHVLLIK
jgi:hypothetical protein